MFHHGRYFSYIFILIAGIYSVRAGEIQGTVYGLEPQWAYLYALYGQEHILVDSVRVKAGGFVHFQGAKYPAGFYHIQFSSGPRIDLVLDCEPAVFSTNIRAIVDSMRVFKSRETRAYYQFVRQERFYDQLIGSLEQLMQQYRHDEKNAEFTRTLKHERDRLNKVKSEARKELIKEYPGSLLATLVKTIETPQRSDNQEYWDAYPDEKSFLREHYFDNIDFNDSRILSSPFLVGNYRQYFDWIEPRKESTYLSAVLNLLQKTKENEEIHSFTLSYLIRYFKNRPYPNVLQQLQDLCHADSICRTDSTLRINDFLLLGKRAPQIVLPDADGTLWDVHQLDSEFVLIVFWSPECESCHHALKYLEKFSHYSPEHLSIFTIALSDNDFLWRGMLDWFTMNCIHTIDRTGRTSTIAKKFLIDSVPAFYILDRNGIIQMVSFDISAVQAQLLYLENQSLLD